MPHAADHDAHAPCSPPASRAHRRGLRRLALSLALLTSPALANPQFEGRFQGRGEGQLELHVFTMDGSGIAGTEGGYFVNGSTSVLNTCSGDLRGLAREIAPRTLRLSKPTGSGDTCELTLRFSTDFIRVQMEGRKCFDFHGASCAFSGSLRRR